MRVLLDACVPERLRHSLAGHTVETARFAGLQAFDDGVLLNAVEGRYDVLLTCDQGLQWQQSFSGRSIAVVVVIAPTNRLADLIPLVPRILAALSDVSAGEIRTVSA